VESEKGGGTGRGEEGEKRMTRVTRTEKEERRGRVQVEA
jgi:hypothetical protein